MPLRTDPIFKGCTRPSLLYGAPMTPLFVACVPLALLGMWGVFLSPPLGIALLLMIIPVWLTMRLITIRDDQRLMQWMLRLRMQGRQANKHHWKATTYSPIRYKRRMPR